MSRTTSASSQAVEGILAAASDEIEQALKSLGTPSEGEIPLEPMVLVGPEFRMTSRNGSCY